ncbi:FadR/GntR family transcriptional regulator [Paracoccus sp. CPCC 101403]|uniref:FadR/GntR family transcriptional regulator n=1 Tax=Paracoccus broussonetiae TaxID=3075834 RepID=A0ABU3EE97_9RHOB|nr:FadR/GntR family transcriptional regulator [Paracoccus sp. CPCC 101403]MDT1062563.1 FadR/GntR family transcriptional regulator [Paracoccus sp. CPCC 101403]
MQKLLLDDPAGFGTDLRRLTIKDRIAEKIAALIASGLLAPGDELPSERDLAQALSVSRETVRVAIQLLAARGILAVSQGSRTRVLKGDIGDMAIGMIRQIDVNRYDIDEVHAARLLIEQHVVGEAATRITEQVLAVLRHSLRSQRDCVDDPVRFLIADREFHLTIYRACGSELLADVVADLYGHIIDHRRRIVSRAGAISESVSDHEEILAALEARDPAATRAAFARHEERIYNTTRDMLGTARKGREGA